MLSKTLLLLLHLDTLHDMVKLGFHYLFLLVFCHIMHIYCSSCAEFDTCPKHCDTTKFVKSNLLCCTFYIHVSTYVLQHTHVIFCCSCMWKLLHMYELVSCDFAISSICFCSEEYLFISNFNVHIFFIIFMNVRHVCESN